MPSFAAVLTYLKYLVRHKWYVFVKCASYGLWWRGLTHDLSKFLPAEFFPYVEHFHGGKKRSGGETIGQPKRDPAFERAWFLHQKRNSHHWQWWVCITSKGEQIPMPMSRAARLEMICDWYGAGMAQGDPDIRGWYERNKHAMLLHPKTFAWVEQNL